MKILVTGGAGFIGSSLGEELLNKKHEIMVLDNLSTGKKENIHTGVNFIYGDIRDYELLKNITKEVHYIFHLAAFVSVPASIENPNECYEVNVGGTSNVIKAAEENGVKKIIFSSSCAVYGGNQNNPANENCRIDLSSPYADSKYQAEQLLKNCCCEYISLRYFNVFGQRQDPESPYSAVIPRFISGALKGEDIIVYGTGEQTRDFIYVRDVVNANINAIESNAKNDVFNVGTGKIISVNHLAKLVIEKCRSVSQIKYEPEKTGDIRFSLADITKATQNLGWKPECNFEDALANTIEWYNEAKRYE